MEDEAGAGMDSLPPEVLQHLFSFLDTKALYAVANVCRAWRALSAPLWRRRSVQLGEQGMKCVLDLAPELGTLRYGRFIEPFGTAFLKHLNAECPCHPSGPTCVSVRHLELHSDSPDAVSTALLRRYSGTAETLTLTAMTPEILRAVSEARSLRELRFRSAYTFSVRDADVVAALLGCVSLTDLEISQFSLYPVLLPDGPGDFMPPSKLIELFVDARGTSVRRLTAPQYCLDDAVLDKVAAKCPGLESLQIEQTDAPRLLPFLPQLREVVLLASIRLEPEEATADLLAAWRAAPDHAKPLAKVERLDMDLHYTTASFDYAVVVLRLCSRLQTLRVTVEGEEIVYDLAEAAAATVTSFEVEMSRCRKKRENKPIAVSLLGALPNLTGVTIDSKRYTRASLKMAL